MATVLIVEDVEDIREMVAESLRQEGYEVVEAENGQQALARLNDMHGEPCLVLLDLMMPVMDGVEFLTRLQENGRLAALPVVVVSAGGSQGQVPQARKFLRKPPSPGLLLQCVREFCGEPAKS